MNTNDPSFLKLNPETFIQNSPSPFPDERSLEKLAREMFGALQSFGGGNLPTSGLPTNGLSSPTSSQETLPYLEDLKLTDTGFSYSNFQSFPNINIPQSGGGNLTSARRDFPILTETVNGKPLVWLDNAATTQKPISVIERLSHFYLHENSNIHRAAHTLAARSTDAYEKARSLVQGFIGAGSAEEIVFVRGTTEGINLLANIISDKHIQSGDEILITHLEHHANIVPWQMVCAKKGAKLKVAPVDDSGQIILSEYERLLNSKTKIVSITQVSNALGTVVPVEEMTRSAHKVGALVIVDGAQSVSHMPVNVQEIDCDFFVFSGHKLFAPTGIGVVYGKKSILDTLPPWQGGGNMIKDVQFDHTTFQEAPFRFEAGTGNIADAVGLGAAIEYLNRFGMKQISAFEHDLLEYGTKELLKIPGLRLIGTAKDKAGVLSFVVDGFKTEEIGKRLAEEGIAVRAGHHCAQPILRRFGLESTVRPSLAFYNSCEDIDALIRVLYQLGSRNKLGI
ncbi:cysteine desulfurase [Leptospira brenneri]|uniref:Cysteine desulfurase n=1 Tax=Leptospira brenneri TaxID=2023182 RepID=A0A5F1ZB91_9LEPT|nr:family 2A encapsulin nanocompartment cargo protein cysteine desulfurase [Leptospira brenneri]TGK96759.1 cysteine desulfurase [Leptospira brenneri]